MTPDILELLQCPACRGQLRLSDGDATHGHVENGTLTCGGCGATYPVARSVARFVPKENYATNFGFQWNHFRRTQLDSYSGLSISRDRFFRQSAWTAADLAGRTVLDVGCGAGRFAEVALSTGARVVAIDASVAVDACWANFAPNERLNVMQCDIYQLPFRPGSFDFIYCFGVLQHTPDVERAFLALCEPLRPGGSLAVDVYPQLLLNLLWPKYWLRPFTRRVPAERLFPIVERMVRLLFPLSLALGRVPVVGGKLRHALPIVNYEGRLPLSREQLEQWAVLDTFDMLAPRYDQPQSRETLDTWFRRAGLESIQVFRDGLVVGRGRRSPDGPRRASAPAARAAAGLSAG